MALNELLTLMSMEAQESETWEFDHNTTTLLILQSNFASLIKGCMIVSHNFQNPEKLDILGLINGLVETLEWLSNNIQMNRKENDGEK